MAESVTDDGQGYVGAGRYVAGVIETVRYSYRLRPGVRAESALLAEWDRCRFLWNEAVHLQKIGQRPNFAGLCKLLTEARGRVVWLRDGSQVAQQQVLRTYSLALAHSFKVKGRGRPKFKSRKKTNPSLEYTTRGFIIRGGRLRLPGGVSIPVVWSRDLPSRPSSVRVYQDKHDGRVWAKSVVDHHQVIAVEDSKPKFLARSTMARKSADAAIGAAKAELIERGKRAGRTVVLVPPAYTTMTCSRCCERQARLGLAERTFRCARCGFTAGRDLNAARVILATAERIRAGVDDVRHVLHPLKGVVGAVRVRNPPASAVGNR